MLNRVSKLVNYGYGEDLGICKTTPLSSWGTKTEGPYTDLQSMLQNDQRNIIQEKKLNEEDCLLNRRGGKYLNNIYENNEEFRKEIIHFIRDKKE